MTLRTGDRVRYTGNREHLAGLEGQVIESDKPAGPGKVIVRMDDSGSELRFSVDQLEFIERPGQ